MARVSLDDLSSAESSKSSSSKASTHKHDHGSHSAGSGGKGGGKAGGGAGAMLSGMDAKQKVKAAVAVVIIVVAGAFIAWNTGMLDSKPRIDANAAPDATAEQVEQYNEAVRAEEARQQKSSGNTRLPPMPLGAN